MSFLKNFIKIDQFGSLFSLHVQGSDEKYKSLAGALATIFLYSAAIGYLFYLLALWTIGGMLPKIISETKFLENGHDFMITQTPFYFSIEAYGADMFEELKDKKFFSF